MNRKIKVLLLVVSVITVSLIFADHFLSIARVDGKSMEPSYRDGSILFLQVRNFDIKKQDVVVSTVKLNGKQEKILKRVVATAGDIVYARHNYLYVNDEPVKLNGTIVRCSSGYRELQKDEIFLVGDNQMESMDSRDFGAVKCSSVVGKVLLSFE